MKAKNRAFNRCSVEILSRVRSTIGNSFLQGFVQIHNQDYTDRIASGLPLISDPLENLGMFLNAFTLLFVATSMLVQLAAICWWRERSSKAVLTQTGMS